MNKLYVGFSKEVELPKGGYLFIGDEVADVPRARVFDPLKHCFNPLKQIDHKKAREIAELFYAISPQGENTLTVRNGRRALARSLIKSSTLDRFKVDEEKAVRDEVEGMVDDVLFSPVVKRVLCTPRQEFSFNPRSVILARLNRAELGERDALVLGLLLIAQFKGQVVVPDFGFYGRDIHTSLIRGERLIAGVYYLDELRRKAPELRQNVLLMREKVARGATFEDAEILAQYDCKFPPNTDGYDTFIKAAMS